MPPEPQDPAAFVARLCREIAALPPEQRRSTVEQASTRLIDSILHSVDPRVEGQPDTEQQILSLLRGAGVGPTPPAPDRIGPYRILQLIGEGGMGTVYLAEQNEPIRRRVALKVIKPGMDSRRIIQRFERERQVLALMSHDGIARILDCAATERGQPYFAMEYVDGTPITRFCDERKMPLAGRLKLVQQLCSAVQHAHQKGVVHRDLKPTNILVVETDDGPRVRVIDFGLAKALGTDSILDSMFTPMGQFVGTPEYMAPEQASSYGAEVDTRADIYSIGVVLYEMLVGEQPFSGTELRKAGLVGIQRTLREVEPLRPSLRLNRLADSSSTIAEARRTTVGSLQRNLRSDLDWLVMKTLEKEPDRRYATADALAADVQRFLDHEPLSAGPPSSIYRLRKFVRKHRRSLGLLAALGAALSTAGWFWWTGHQARREREAYDRFLDGIRIEAEGLPENLRKPIQLALSSMKEHRLWRCVYADGFVVYNRFRTARSREEVVDYFSGRSPHPDDEAYHLTEHGPEPVQFDAAGASELIARHGAITAIEPLAH